VKFCRAYWRTIEASYLLEKGKDLAGMVQTELLCWINTETLSSTPAWWYMPIFSLSLFFEMGSFYLAQAALELMILLPQPPKCWHYRWASPFPTTQEAEDHLSQGV
jgi:hypothetical protein